MNLIDKLHHKFKYMKRVSPALVKRHTKRDWEDCEDICDELRDRRIKDGIDRKKWGRIK